MEDRKYSAMCVYFFLELPRYETTEKFVPEIETHVTIIHTHGGGGRRCRIE